MKCVKILSLLLSGAISLMGCDSNGTLGMEESPAWHKRTSVAEKVQYFTPQCEAYGFSQGSEAFKQCVADEIRESRQAARDKMARVFSDDNSSYTKPIVCNRVGQITTCY
jgi:uncharacterized protein YoaH (UPF0181 family)